MNASASGIGNGGSIDIAAGSLEVGFEGSITASSGGEGDGGSISIDAESVLIEELGKISVDSFGRGNGGSIDINAGTIDIIDGEIFAYPEDNVRQVTITSLPSALPLVVAPGSTIP